ncbi:putative central pair associated wd-repeat protein [Monocercomonoides exilis]|uniref:putative central pair associated wd-repeat protein n=1 Tax=Monocercomonoides exilis TaxID=2049356 RepID=UPI003559C4F4|nr:putative central pair associated wd-repeat protein [Monocercomonoides exilis]|eukprot:MONOS_6269.1-p1 / transcript=MONOS_6269.1 / gene=MONOS_6269 / organism=Monocercomonoides_exilis_PA203 / gene_product=Sperm-associated antigen 16 protein / transcript_product=Sperm-associated antigen 16 protein / location=Mono_scaffold00195:39094-42412(+) / protein_length=670 / sequence_SO=supercontig / SO=protein_coding / is_pseudo=false
MASQFDDDDDFVFEEVPLEKFELAPDEEENDISLESLKAAVKIPEKAPTVPQRPILPQVSNKPVVVEDFIRNYLKKMKMERTLEMFQMEWYECAHDSTTDPVVDAYAQIQELTEQVFRLKEELQAKTEFAEKASGLFEKLRKERDFHKMHHRRVVEEKNKLIRDMKRLVKHNANYEPVLREMKSRYEAVMKDKMLLKLEKDKYINRVEILEETVRQLQSYSVAGGGGQAATLASSVLATSPLKAEADGGSRLLQPTASSLMRAKETAAKHGMKVTKDGSVTARRGERRSADVGPGWMAGAGGGGPSGTKPRRAASAERASAPTVVPLRVKPRPSTPPQVAAPASKVATFKATKNYNCHSMPITSLAFYPNKDEVVTTSDDGSWKMWAIPGGEFIKGGNEHKEWVSEAAFHPNGSKLVTASGDCTVKLWDYSTGACTATFTDHTGPVWSVSFHDSGDFFSSSSSDSTIKIWDMRTQACRFTLRGHVDSVNDAHFIPFTSAVCSCSADKTVSLWDVRTGRCAESFFGHTNGCNRVAYDPDGYSLASSDADGVVCLWDTRTVKQRGRFNCGPKAANGLSFDGSGQVLVVGSDDGTIKIIDIEEELSKSYGQTMARTRSSFSNTALSTLSSPSSLPPITKVLKGHSDCVLDVLFDKQNRYLLSCSTDRTMILWC